MKHVVVLRGVAYFKRRGYGAHKLPEGSGLEAAYNKHLRDSEALKSLFEISGPDIEQFMPRVITNMSSARKRAKQQSVPYEISEAWFRERYARARGRCELTGIPFHADREKRAPFFPSIDRIESARGYVPDNCRLICYIANCAKNQFTDDEFRLMCRGACRHWANGD